MLVFAAPDEHLCGTATLVEQLAATQGREAVRALGGGARLADALAVVEEGSVVFLISDEHGVVVEDEQAASVPVFAEALATAHAFADGLAKLFK